MAKIYVKYSEPATSNYVSFSFPDIVEETSCEKTLQEQIDELKAMIVELTAVVTGHINSQA